MVVREMIDHLTKKPHPLNGRRTAVTKHPACLDCGHTHGGKDHSRCASCPCKGLRL